MLARSKLNSLESRISEAIINNEISYEDFKTIINEERNYQELKETIRNMSSQKSIWLKKVKKWALTRLSNAMKLLITV